MTDPFKSIANQLSGKTDRELIASIEEHVVALSQMTAGHHLETQSHYDRHKSYEQSRRHESLMKYNMLTWIKWTSLVGMVLLAGILGLLVRFLILIQQA